MSRQQSNFDAANFVFAWLKRHPPNRIVPAQHNLIDRSLVFARVKTLLRLVLHVEEFADPLFVPTKATQIIATTTLVQGQQKRRVFRRNRAQTYGGKRSELGHRWGILI